MRNGKEVDEHGNIFYYKKGRLHREDGPAVEYYGGDGVWYKDGLIHREDGPAVMWDGEVEEWWIKGCKLNDQEILQHKLKNLLK